MCVDVNIVLILLIQGNMRTFIKLLRQNAHKKHQLRFF
jgi:hypothetical protein